MKKVIFIVICLFVALGTLPKTGWSLDKEKIIRTICVESIGNLAESIMVKRQEGFGMNQLFDAMDNVQAEPPSKKINS